MGGILVDHPEDPGEIPMAFETQTAIVFWKNMLRLRPRLHKWSIGHVKGMILLLNTSATSNL